MGDGGGERERWNEGVGEGFFFFFLGSFCTLNPAPFFMSVYWKSLLNPSIKTPEVCVCVCTLREA